MDRRRKSIFCIRRKKSNQAGELDFTYYNAIYTVENALAKVKDEKGMKRVEKFLKERYVRHVVAAGFLKRRGHHGCAELDWMKPVR